MKRMILSLIAAPLLSLPGISALAQQATVPDQNPDYRKSLEKYVRKADSLNEWHSTTQHDMYKAIDWLEDRREARADRREFRQKLRLERARWYGSDLYYNNYGYGRYYRPYYYNHRRSGWGVRPYYGLDFWWR